MAITVEINSVDRSDHIEFKSLQIEQNLTSLVDRAKFNIRKYGTRTYTPTVGNDIVVYDGSDKIFGGEITGIQEEVESGGGGVVYEIEATDWTYLFDSELVFKAYDSETVEDIIDDIVTNFTDGSFTTNNVSSTFTIDSIVFNGVSPSRCLKRLADILNYDWYIDPDKDIHFFAKFSELAPYDLQDDSGNYIYKTLKRKIDGTQIANTVYVRGGEYNADTYTDEITVSGSDTKSFLLPYKFANLSIELDTGSGFVAQTLGVDFISDFSSVDVLYNYAEKTIRWENALSSGDIIKFSGNPKVPVRAVASDPVSIAEFGTKEKIIEDKTIEDLATARRRAVAEVNTYKDEVEDLEFRTYNSGVRAGQTINLSSTVRNCDIDFIIRKVTFKTLTPTDYFYKVTCITTRKLELVTLLQELMEPDPKQNDADEVAEIIEVNTNTITVTESITSVSATEIDDTITITEDIDKDPLGLDTEPTWVVGYYAPTSLADTKRQGLLNRTMKVY